MNDHLGAALQEARAFRGLEQHELAALLGVSVSTISKVEHGSRTLSAAEFLTLGLIFPDWFEMQASDLFTDLKADLAARLREFLDGKTFKPTEFQKRDWLRERLAKLDDGVAEIA